MSSETKETEEYEREFKGLRKIVGDMAETEGRMIGLFALLVIISGNFLAELFPFEVREILNKNIYVKHLFAFLTLFFFVYLTMPDVKHEGPGVVFGIYLIFLMTSKLPPKIWFTLVGLITLLYLEEVRDQAIKEKIEEGESNEKEIRDKHEIAIMEDWVIPSTILSIIAISTYGFFDIIRNYLNTPLNKRHGIIQFLFEKRHHK
jgi:hypothetical protein